MKKRFFILTAAMLLLTVTVNAENEGNLLTNGSFENGIAGYGIAYSSKSDTVMPKAFVSDKYANDGDFALEFVAGADLEYKTSTSKMSKGFAYQGVYSVNGFEAKAGMEYTLSADMYTNNENVKMRFVVTDGSNAVYASEEMELGAGYWNSASYVWMPEKNYYEAKIRVVFYDINKGDKVYIDKLNIVPDALSNEMWKPMSKETLSVNKEKVSFSAVSELFKDGAGAVSYVSKNLLDEGVYALSGYISTDLEKAYVKLSCGGGAEKYFIVKKGERHNVQLVFNPKDYDCETLEMKVEVFGNGTQMTHKVDMYDFNIIDSGCIINIEEISAGNLKIYGALRQGNENSQVDVQMTNNGSFHIYTDSNGEYSFTKSVDLGDELQKIIMVELSSIKGYSDAGNKISAAYTLINKELINTIAQQADEKTSTSELSEVISEELLDALEVTTKDVYRMADSSFVIAYLADKDISSYDKLKKEILTAACISALNANKLTLSEVLDEYAQMLGMEEIALYKDLYSKADKQTLNEKFAAHTNTISDTDSLGKAVSYVLVKTQLENEATYSAAMELVKKYSENIGLDLTAYNSLDSAKQYTVQSTFIEYVKNENDYTKLSGALQEYITSIQNQGSQQGGGSSGGGGSYGGGSSGGGSGITSTEVTVNKNQYKFIDLGGYGWAEESIYKLYGKGIISQSDDNCFNPQRNITRAEFAKMIAVMYEKNDYDDEEVYSDVTRDKWYYSYVMALKKHGIINGVSQTLFAADAYITRQDICVIIARLHGAADGTAQTDFADFDTVSEYAKAAVGFMYENGYISGYDDETFRPMNFATRAEVAKILGALN